MTDYTSTPQNDPPDSGQQTDNPPPLAVTGLLDAEYTCPICNAVILRIEGNTMQYLQSHADPPITDGDGYVTVALHHKFSDTNYYPAKGAQLPRPFLVVKSQAITS